MRVYEAKLTYEATKLDVGSTSLSRPELVYAYMKDTLEVHPMQEVFYVILLNRKNHALGRIAVTIGTATASLAHPREVFRPAIVGGATSIICTHNHPSGVMPSAVLCRWARRGPRGIAFRCGIKRSATAPFWEDCERDDGWLRHRS